MFCFCFSPRENCKSSHDEGFQTHSSAWSYRKHVNTGVTMLLFVAVDLFMCCAPCRYLTNLTGGTVVCGLWSWILQNYWKTKKSYIFLCNAKVFNKYILESWLYVNNTEQPAVHDHGLIVIDTNVKSLNSSI